MKILALEFSSPQRSVAVLNPETGSTVEVVDNTNGPAMKPFGLIRSALEQAGLEREQIEAVAVGLGPGSYTGIRAAIALAQGWQLATGVKLCGISSAECLAAEEAVGKQTGRFNVVIDAQRGEFYLAAYKIIADNLKEISPLQIVSAEIIHERLRAGERVVGPEVPRWFSNARQIFPRAATLARMASTMTGFVSGEKLEPIYLRETTFVKAPSAKILHA